MPDLVTSTRHLDRATIERLLSPYLAGRLPEPALVAFEQYLDLLLTWNGRFNLTAIRQPEEIVSIHFGECLFCARRLPPGIGTLLDYGSGAGFPGVPIQIARPDLRIVLAESQLKKSNFLRTAVEALGLSSEVLAGRVESLPADRVFDAVALRAVDRMPVALKHAARRIRPGGYLILLTTETQRAALQSLLPKFSWLQPLPIPNSVQKILLIGQ